MDQFDRAINRILSEVFLDTEYATDPRTKKASRKEIDFSNLESKKGIKIGSIKEYDIYKRDTQFPNGTSTTICGVTDEIKIAIKGELLSTKVFREKSLESKAGNLLKVDELYHYLIDQLGYTIISDTVQSIGGKMVWKKLFRYPDIKISYSIKGSNKWKELPVDKRQHYEVLWTGDESSARGDLILKAENANKS